MKNTHKTYLFAALSLSLLLSMIAYKDAWASSCARDAYCCGSGCEGLDPQGTNCMWGVGYYGRTPIVSSRDPSKLIGIVELIYSSRCDANWSRVETMGDGWVETFVSKPPSRYGRVVARSTSATAHYVWSKMTDGSRRQEALGSVSLDTGDSGYSFTPAY